MSDASTEFLATYTRTTQSWRGPRAASPASLTHAADDPTEGTT